MQLPSIIRCLALFPDKVPLELFMMINSPATSGSSSIKSPMLIAKLCKHAVDTISVRKFSECLRRGMRRQQNLCFHTPNVLSTFPLVAICTFCNFFLYLLQDCSLVSLSNDGKENHHLLEVAHQLSYFQT